VSKEKLMTRRFRAAIALRRPQEARRRSNARLRVAAWTVPSAILAAMALLAPPAMASGKPTGEYAPFTQCPLGTMGVNQCVYIATSSGELVFGKATVPITKTITLQGGLIVSGGEETFVEATEGKTLSKTPEEVSGGFEGPLTLTLELVGAVTLSQKNLAEGKGATLTLPVRAHLKNAFVGESCFIGSGTKPITLNLTTGTTSPPPPNKAIKGSGGTKETKEGGNLIVYKADSLVDNAFSVPQVEGCGTLVTPILNAKFGLPSAAGHNSAILNGNSEFASAKAVKESE
jgi:hypothetical protein